MATQGVPTTADPASEQLIENFAGTFSAVSKSAMFACGGSIPVTTSASDASDGRQENKHKEDNPDIETKESNVQADHVRSSPPICIRLEGCGKALLFPTGEQSSLFQQLISATEPASFGYQGRDVIDETYRKATKLDTSQFLTDFDPHGLGIVEIINQLLLPSVELHRGVRAELYKLNVYSGPSGHFKAHVDTPRSNGQVGSLVVALPMHFQGGGDLLVRHEGETVRFDWSQGDQDEPTIKWAAFYSDCEHEVEEVKSGHRVTLTYNLYLAQRPGLLTGSSTAMDATQLPLYLSLADLLGCPDFMTAGGKLGVVCSHAYPHTNDKMHSLLPDMLKGVDMALYEAAKAHKLQYDLITCLDSDEEDYSEVYRETLGGKDLYFRGTQQWLDTDEGGDDGDSIDFRSYFPNLQTPHYGTVTWIYPGGPGANSEQSLAYMHIRSQCSAHMAADKFDHNYSTVIRPQTRSCIRIWHCCWRFHPSPNVVHHLWLSRPHIPTARISI
ncbi:hypothetical protein EJ05DRAFT_267040 [Pseudovirgaria hyperparasitica]|uniref:Fe2OG dioxygenase domain-containing protein n=1 Tax=Pseudovirgaria hyperparasitica TaxID=470096 RepID=A0A6A6VQ27_9PEZI|nr:uncharacterized protein EJ05DRAFT_267040 [Pseudovirgaria hyperparasitica]KAF2752722.1 hypothetical protein EJ05DRAFT_267040 [Pseudovirgaria hyperparasitica]